MHYVTHTYISVYFGNVFRPQNPIYLIQLHVIKKKRLRRLPPSLSVMSLKAGNKLDLNVYDLWQKAERETWHVRQRTANRKSGLVWILSRV